MALTNLGTNAQNGLTKVVGVRGLTEHKVAELLRIIDEEGASTIGGLNVTKAGFVKNFGPKAGLLDDPGDKVSTKAKMVTSEVGPSEGETVFHI